MLLFDPATALLALLIALALDRVVGDPPWLWTRLPHPVVVLGALIGGLELHFLGPDAAARQKLVAGGIVMAIVLLLATATGLAATAVLKALPGAALWQGILISTLIALKSLDQHVRSVADGLDHGLGEGREAVRHIVGRDPESLDEAGVARAAIESSAENFADGVVAPALYALLFGLPGALAYKAINTADSMIGHKTERHLHFGRMAARLDDVVNWPAARLAGLLIALASGGPEAFRAMMRDAPKHRSPNAGWPEAAMAGALGLRLAGPRRYGGSVVQDAWMGNGRADASPADIRFALRLIGRAWWLMLLPLVLMIPLV